MLVRDPSGPVVTKFNQFSLVFTIVLILLLLAGVLFKCNMDVNTQCGVLKSTG